MCGSSPAVPTNEPRCPTTLWHIAHIHSMTSISLSLYLSIYSAVAVILQLPVYVSIDRHLLLTRQSYRGICRKSFIRTFVVMCVCVCMCVYVCVCVCPQWSQWGVSTRQQWSRRYSHRYICNTLYQPLSITFASHTHTHTHTHTSCKSCQYQEAYPPIFVIIIII